MTGTFSGYYPCLVAVLSSNHAQLCLKLVHVKNPDKYKISKIIHTQRMIIEFCSDKNTPYVIIVISKANIVA